MSVRSVRAFLSIFVTVSLAAGTVSAVSTGAVAEEDRPTYLGKSHFTGEFHAHTEVSDGVEMPEDAFEHVAENSDADFFTVSEHDVLYDRRNSDDFTTDWRDAVSEEWRYLHEASDEYNASQDDLVTLPAEEITWYDESGHMNLFNTDWLATARAEGDSLSFGAATGDLKYDLPTFYARLKQDPDAIAQFNHPDPDGKGSFFGFRHLDPEVDERVELIEAKNDTQRKQYQAALDAGWHVAPVWNGDEHSANWITSDDAITGVWATDKTREAVYDAMHARSMYSTEDVNTVLEFGANKQLMGSLLPAETTSLALDIALTDADESESFSSVQVLTNEGEVAYDVPTASGAEVNDSHTIPAEDGDYFYVRATQADGDVIVSAPVWVGETTRGANYAPTIDVPDVPSRVAYAERVELPEVTAEDDSGSAPEVTYEVWDDNGKVKVTDGTFRVRSYSDHVIVVKATDAAGSVGAKMIRLPVTQQDADPNGVYAYLGSAATVGQLPGHAGLSVSTDMTVDRAYAQVRRVGRRTWRNVSVRTSTDDSTYEINTIGKPGGVYQDTVTGQPLRSHEFDLERLRAGKRYEYRFGVAVDGEAPSARDDAWTDVQGTFTAGGGRARPLYFLGDLSAESRRPAELGLMRDTLRTLQRRQPRGDTVVQTGDLVSSGVHREFWEDAFDHVYAGLGLQIAPVVGDGESDFDREYNILSPKRNSIFSNMYALPDSGPIGESNYSFDRDNVHVAVLNTVYDLETQLDWLVKDIRRSEQPWNVVVGHRSYFGGKGADGPGMARTRDRISKLFTRLGVDLYVGGHDNVYKRSRIYDGQLAETRQEKADGTTFVTLGSAGPRFGDNRAQPWDDVVIDEDVQLGTAVRASPSRLSLTTYARDGKRVDKMNLRRQHGPWRVSSAEIVDAELDGVGLVSHRGNRRSIAVEAVAYDSADQEVIDRQLVDVDLDHRGAEQWAGFDEPLQVGANDTVKLHFWRGPRKRHELRDAMVLREGLAGDGTAGAPYLLDSGDDLEKIANDPAATYRITKDLDLDGIEIDQVGAEKPFTGELDGAGHSIIGMTNDSGGLIESNEGSVHDLALVDADVSSAGTERAGILADMNTGTVERVYTTGLITGKSRVGGILGDNAGALRDAYSTARVQSASTEAGGTVGVALAGSTTERVYATGSVGASTKNAGGVAGYGYSNTILQDSLALNPKVRTPTYAHRVLGRVRDGEKASLTNNWAGAGVDAEVPSVPESGADTLMGASASAEQVGAPAFYRDTLGWDLKSVWKWSAEAERPVLRAVPEQIEPSPDPDQPDLPQADDGAFLVSEPGDLEHVTRFPGARYRLAADLDLSEHEGLNVARAGFSGEFDGAGHRITGHTSSRGGLFPLITDKGHVHDVALDGASVDTTADNVGLLVDTSRGMVERVSTSGKIYGGSTVGGVVGYSYGELRDSYSTADVYATTGRQAGGVAGITGRGSLTEFTYAIGQVEVIDDANAGGISGYAYAGTTVRHNMALNSEVVGTGYAHRVVARVLAGEQATLADNAASEDVKADVQSVPETGPESLNGATRTATEVQRQATYADMGWNFEKVWKFDSTSGRPVLRTVDGR